MSGLLPTVDEIISCIALNLRSFLVSLSPSGTMTFYDLTDGCLNLKFFEYKRFQSCSTINWADGWLEPVEFQVEILHINNLKLSKALIFHQNNTNPLYCYIFLKKICVHTSTIFEKQILKRFTSTGSHHNGNHYRIIYHYFT